MISANTNYNDNINNYDRSQDVIAISTVAVCIYNNKHRDYAQCRINHQCNWLLGVTIETW